MTFPACLPEIPGDRLAVFGQWSSQILISECYYLGPIGEALYQQQLLNRPPSSRLLFNLKRVFQIEVLSKNSFTFVLSADKNLHPISLTQQPGFLLFTECYRWLPGRKPSSCLNCALGNLGGLELASPLLSFQTSLQNPTELKIK